MLSVSAWWCLSHWSFHLIPFSVCFTHYWAHPVHTSLQLPLNLCVTLNLPRRHVHQYHPEHVHISWMASNIKSLFDKKHTSDKDSGNVLRSCLYCSPTQADTYETNQLVPSIDSCCDVYLQFSISFTDENAQKQSDDLGAQFTEQFVQDPEHVTLLLTLLEVLNCFCSSGKTSVLLYLSKQLPDCQLIHWLFLGVWLPCTLARGKAVDYSPEEPGCPGPGYHSGQPHGWASPLHIYSNWSCSVWVLLAQLNKSHKKTSRFVIKGFPTWFLTAVFISIVRCFQIDGPIGRL